MSGHRRSTLLADWWTATRETRSLATPVDRAFAGGVVADRLGFAFAAGYAEALLFDVAIAALSRQLGLIPAGGNYVAIQRRTRELAVDTSHFTAGAGM